MITTAQFTYIPLKASDPRESVDFLLELVAQHDVEVDVNYMSTSVRGETEVVFELIHEMYNTMTIEKEEFRFHVELLSPVAEDKDPVEIPTEDD
ncbi:thiamine-binding protein [Fodinibius saliphilus]|uniref:thiamine-binding protein n=1 Tax=Fodinibius saliphilus TaxID=1920650 RepID=UPI0011083435|nr:thiamine-binding protein [Fodinibius saliphilus]